MSIGLNPVGTTGVLSIRSHSSTASMSVGVLSPYSAPSAASSTTLAAAITSAGEACRSIATLRSVPAADSSRFFQSDLTCHANRSAPRL